MPRVWHRSQALVTRRDRRKQKVAAHARRKQICDPTVTFNVSGGLAWIARKLLEGGLPALGKLAAEWAWKGGAGVAAVWLWEWLSG